MTISVDDKSEEIFRTAAEKRFGAKKGTIQKAMTEAMTRWAEDEKQRVIAQRAIERMEKGLYKLPKGYKFTREECYE